MNILNERKPINTVVCSGVYITKLSAYDLSVVVNCLINAYGINCLDVSEVRIVMETATAGKAAQNAAEKGLDELEHALEGLRDPMFPIEECVQRDFGFQLSRNDMLAILTEAMISILSNIISAGIVASCKLDEANLEHPAPEISKCPDIISLFPMGNRQSMITLTSTS